MRFIYTFGIYCYALGVRIAALFNPKAKLMVAGWKHTFGRLALAPVGQDRTVWFHASSLGEYEQARPVLNAFRQQHPDYKVCVTFFSPSGYEVRKNTPEADFVCYLPMDTRANARRFVNLLRPTVAFFVKYDYWFNYLEQLRMRGIPTYMFSAIYRPDQYFFRWYGTWYMRQLKDCFHHIFVQNETSLKLLQTHGVDHCSIAGDTRFDRVHQIVEAAERNEVVEAWLEGYDGKVLVCGSTWPPDEEALVAVRKANADWFPGRIILAPHVIGEEHLRQIERLFPDSVRYSRLVGSPEEGNSGLSGKAGVLIIDNIGILSKLYRYGDVAYIGGGFGRGIHNILEAVTFGKPVVFGPNYHKFQEACDIIARGGGWSYQRHEALQAALETLLRDDVAYARAVEACHRYMEENLGATEKILSQVNPNNF